MVRESFREELLCNIGWKMMENEDEFGETIDIVWDNEVGKFLKDDQKSELLFVGKSIENEFKEVIDIAWRDDAKFSKDGQKSINLGIIIRE